MSSVCRCTSRLFCCRAAHVCRTLVPTGGLALPRDARWPLAAGGESSGSLAASGAAATTACTCCCSGGGPTGARAAAVAGSCPAACCGTPCGMRCMTMCSSAIWRAYMISRSAATWSALTANASTAAGWRRVEEEGGHAGNARVRSGPVRAQWQGLCAKGVEAASRGHGRALPPRKAPPTSRGPAESRSRLARGCC